MAVAPLHAWEWVIIGVVSGFFYLGGLAECFKLLEKEKKEGRLKANLPQAFYKDAFLIFLRKVLIALAVICWPATVAVLIVVGVVSGILMGLGWILTCSGADSCCGMKFGGGANGTG